MHPEISLLLNRMEVWLFREVGTQARWTGEGVKSGSLVMLPLVLWGLTKRGSRAFVEGNSQAPLRTFATCPVNPWGVSDNKHLQTKQSIKAFLTTFLHFLQRATTPFPASADLKGFGHPPTNRVLQSQLRAALCKCGPLAPLAFDGTRAPSPHRLLECRSKTLQRVGRGRYTLTWDLPLHLPQWPPDKTLSVVTLSLMQWPSPAAGTAWQCHDNSTSKVCQWSHRLGFFLYSGK